MAKLGEVLFNFLIKLLLIVGLFLWFKISVGWTVLLAPMALMALILFGTSIGILLAPLGFLYNDVIKGLSIVSIFWLILTPVVYSTPEEGVASILVNLNPVTHLLVTTRELATIGIVTAPMGFTLSLLLTRILLIVSLITFRAALPFVIERLSA